MKGLGDMGPPKPSTPGFWAYCRSPLLGGPTANQNLPKEQVNTEILKIKPQTFQKKLQPEPVRMAQGPSEAIGSKAKV